MTMESAQGGVEAGERSVRLPFGLIAAMVACVCVLGFSVGWGAGSMAGRAGALANAGVAAGAVFLGVLVSLAGAQLWRERPASRWPIVLFAAQGASLVLSGVAAGVAGWALLYSPPLLDAFVLLGVLSTSWIAVWVAVAKVMAAALSSLPSGPGGTIGAGARADGGGVVEDA